MSSPSDNSNAGDARDEQLNETLTDWAQARQAAPERLQRLGRQIVSAVEQQAEQMPPPTHRRRQVGTRIVWGCVAVATAAAVWVAATVLFRGPVDNAQQQQLATATNAAELARIDATARRSKLALLAELRELFPGQWQWVVESGSQIQLEIGDRSQPSPEALLVRVTMARRQRGESQWVRVWSVDCLTRGEELVELQTPEEAGLPARLALWTYPVEDRLIAIDSRLALDSPANIECNYSGVQDDGVPREVSSVRTNAAEYQVFQTVTRLDPQETS